MTGPPEPGRPTEELSAVEWMHRGADHLDENDLDRAERCYRRAIELDPSLRGAWFDLGLVYKWRRQWPESLQCNRRAAELPRMDDADPDPAYWNAGIAATALEDWPVARWAWQGYGIRVPGEDGPIEADFGLGVVRLPDGETVWGKRIDPARLVVTSIPLPESGFRHGDIVLHDGEPRGARVAGGREYSVFDVIARWRASPVPTVKVEVEAQPEAVSRLVAALEDHAVPAENWTESVTLHCKACSLGRVDYDHPDHEHPAIRRDGTASVGCSGDRDRIAAIVASWSAAEHATVHGVDVVS